MRLYRASQRSRTAFDPLDSSSSVARRGWRFNDKSTEVLYASEAQSLALLEVIVRPEFEPIDQITVAAIEVPDGTIMELEELSISLPTNWNSRPAGRPR